MEIPLNPISKEEIHRLESILLFATLFRPEVIEIIENPVERLTWVDILAVAAGAIAREKARMFRILQGSSEERSRQSENI